MNRPPFPAHAVVRGVVVLVLGLALGVLGLPRLEISLPAVEPGSATSPTAGALADVEPTLPRPPTPTPIAPTPTPSAPRILLDERFDGQPAGWPNDPRGTAWFAAGQYHMFAREPSRFVAIGVRLPVVARDARLTAEFHKTGGPPGGGYGLIMRDQGPTEDRDGRNQGGEYLVLEVGDRGDVGVWQRDQTRWIDVLPWTHSEAVHAERRPNVIVASTSGTRVRFEVNGVQVADLSYAGLPASGGIGVFVGGDFNEVVLDWLRMESL